jgi:Domain of unknown function (DUF4396)
MAPFWLQALADLYVPLSVLTAAFATWDIFVAGRRQAMPITNVVWPLTMLYWGPLGLPFYFAFGRAPPAERERGHEERRMPEAAFVGATHCGPGCVLGDFLGDWIAFFSGLGLFGSLFAGKLLLAFLLAYLFGIEFQYFSIAPMRGLSLKDGLVAAVKIDTLSLVAYEIGMFAVMGVRVLVLPGLAPTNLAYWLTMQAAMQAGFATTYPVNWALIRAGVKEAM